MSQFNNLNVLPFYTDLKYQTRNKWYAFGAIWGLASPANSILPFQLSLPYNLTSVESFQVKNLDSSTAYSPSAKPSINNSKFSTRGYSIVKLVETAFDGSYKLPIGTYYIEMKLKDSGDTTYTYYSEVFTVVNNISDFLKIQYWNEDNMYYSSGEINYEDNFKFTMYLCATIGKPEYEFEEELTKRGGYPFLESQISSKLYKFAFIAPEFICDAMRLIRMSDYIRISSNGLDYNALTFSYEPNWEEQGDLASVQAEFTVDDIIQKLASFNRRVKESFYNALLADVNEPMMFDAESIAQHYKSALGGATANLVNGLLIRELEELKEYKDNYYAVLDTGEGAAKKILLSNLLAGIGENIDTSNFVTTDATEQNVLGVKNFNAGITIGSSKIKAYEKDGCLFIDGNLALTGGLTMYAAGTQNVGTIYDGLPIDNDTIYWDTTESGSRVLKAKGGGGEAGSVQWDNISGKPSWIESNKPSYSWSEIQGEKPFYTKEEADKRYVTTNTEQEIAALKHFKKGLSIGEAKKLIYEEDGILFIDANVAVTGALTMYATGPQSVGSIYDGLPIDNDTIYWQEVDGSRVLKAREGSGSSFDKSAMWTALAGSTTEQINKSHLTTALTGYATESWVSGKNYAVKATTLAGYGITDGINAVSVTGTGNAVTAASISGHTLTLTKGATFNNYTHPTATATTITAANGKVLSAITVNNQGHVTSVSGKTLAAADIPTLEISKISGLQDSLDAKLESSAYTAADVLAKLKTVDGSNSGLDADLLDGTHKTALFTALTSSSATNISITVGGTTKSIADLFANSAAKLETARTIWGQSFDGTKPVTGALTSVTDITGTGTFTGANLKATDSVYVNGIRLHKTADGVITLEGNLAVTGGVTMYAIDPVSVSTVMDGVVVDGTTIKKENGKLVAVGGGEAGSVAWGNISGKPSVFATNIANITDLHSSWDSVLAAQKPAWLTAVSIATISDLHANWDALLKAAPSAYVTRWPTISEVTGKQNLVVKLNGGTTEGTNQFTYNATGAKTINITPSGIGAAASSHNHSWSQITSGKPTTLAGYGITDAYTKTESDNRYLNVSGGDTIQGLITINHTTLDNSINIVREGSNNPTICFSNKTKGQLGRIGFNNEGKVCIYFRTSSDESYVWHSTNDGAGSGLDADLLDGTHKSGLLTALTSSSATNISITVGGTTKSISDLYANSAYKLENTHTIWGQNFNGTQNITGRFTSNERVYADKGIWVTNNDIAGWGQSNAAFNLSIPNTSKTSGIICVYRSGQGNTGSARFFSMEISNSSDSVRTYYANEVRIDITPTYMDINKQLNINGNTIIGSGGNLGIGTANPAAKLHVIGDILATGGGTYYGSDIRYKLIMQQVNLSLLDIAEAPSFVYRWNRPNMNQNRLNLGGSAQYTQSVLPWAVEENDNFLSMDYATVAYTFAVHTARHLLTYESRTDKKIKKLENRVKYLEKQLKKLGYEEVRTLDDSGI